MLLLLFPQGTGAAGLDTIDSLLDVVYRLGFQSMADLSASHWISPAELYQFADDAAQRLAYESGSFVTFDASIAITPATPVYALQEAHVFTLYAWLSGAPLRITRVRDLEALDGNWPMTSGPARRCCFDANSVGTVTIYPNPTVGGTLQQVCEVHPPNLTSGASTIALPTVAQDYFSYAMLAGARGKESEAAMGEMASHFQQRMKLYEKVFEHLWGPGE